jgi:hypothetical protein
MHTIILATFVAISRTPVSMCIAGILLFFVALWAAKTDITPQPAISTRSSP